jgi:hypothetical protein
MSVTFTGTTREVPIGHGLKWILHVARACDVLITLRSFLHGLGQVFIHQAGPALQSGEATR